MATADKNIQILATEPETRLLHKLAGHSAAIGTLCWSPTSHLQLLSGAEDQTVRMWEVPVVDPLSGTQLPCILLLLAEGFWA